MRPDTAILNLGVTTEAPTAQAAIAENAARMSAVLSALRRVGAQAGDIQTSGLTLNQRYRNVPNQPPESTGYVAANSVSVTVGDVDKVGALLDAAVAAGANQVRGVGFRAKDTKPAQDQARQGAVRDLQAKAELYAKTAGYRVVRLVSLSEGGVSPGIIPPLPVPPVAAYAPTPVSPGEIVVRETVSAVFELAR